MWLVGGSRGTGVSDHPPCSTSSVHLYVLLGSTDPQSTVTAPLQATLMSEWWHVIKIRRPQVNLSAVVITGVMVCVCMGGSVFTQICRDVTELPCCSFKNSTRSGLCSGDTLSYVFCCYPHRGCESRFTVDGFIVREHTTLSVEVSRGGKTGRRYSRSSVPQLFF